MLIAKIRNPSDVCDYPVFLNPTKEELEASVDMKPTNSNYGYDIKAIRYARLDNGDLYVWNFSMLHRDVVPYLNIDPEEIQEMKCKNIEL